MEIREMKGGGRVERVVKRKDKGVYVEGGRELNYRRYFRNLKLKFSDGNSSGCYLLVSKLKVQ